MLPPYPARFTTRKAAILELLARPDDDYTDASPKGAIDEGIRPLIDVINKLDGFVTTSSCAGRVAVFLEGRKGTTPPVDERSTPAATAPASTIASAGGKGGGGKWLFVSHDPLVNGVAADSTSPPQHSNYTGTDWASVFGLEKDEAAANIDEETVQDNVEQDEERLVHFKFEPMVSCLFSCFTSYGARPNLLRSSMS
jgi:tRNA wybutosine-synthesizing protein 3